MDRPTADNIVWIFGTGRSGSTWLASMMGGLPDHAMWDEPLVGRLFGEFYAENAFKVSSKNQNRETFIMGNATREAWLEGIGFFVLNAAEALFPGTTIGGYLVVKEPNGSVGAPLLMEALPESRMVFLVRDPRDVVASAFARHRKGSEVYERLIKDPQRTDALTKNPPDERSGAFARRQANRYLRHVGNSKQAYEAHKGRKAMVRYEELRADTLSTMRRVYSELGIPAEEGDVARAVDKHAWENIPEQDKGEGKFCRKGISGGWREDLTPKQAEIVEKITAPLFNEFYPD